MAAVSNLLRLYNTKLKYLHGRMRMANRVFSVELFVLKLKTHKKFISNHGLRELARLQKVIKGQIGDGRCI